MKDIRTDRFGANPAIAFDHAGEGPVVVFLHGIGGNRSNWTDQIRAVAAAGFHGVAWDARGYGASDDYEGPLDFADFSHDLARLLDHLGAETAHLLGLSMGGRILMDFHARYPERCATLILCSCFTGFTHSFTPEKRQEFVRLRKQPLVEGKTPREMADGVVTTLIGPKAGPDIRQRLIDSVAAIHPQSYIKTVEASAFYERTAALPNMHLPVQLIFASDDRLTTPAMGEDMLGRLPQAAMEVIPDAGHLSNIEKPEAFNAILLRFLETHRDRARRQ